MDVYPQVTPLGGQSAATTDTPNRLPKLNTRVRFPVIGSTLIRVDTARRCSTRSLSVMSASHSRIVRLASVCPILSDSSRRAIKLPDLLAVAKT
jgi:hypothetical protein